MNKKHIELLQCYCSDNSQFTNLDLMFDRGEVSTFKKKYRLEEAIIYLKESGYLISKNDNEFSVLLTNKGLSLIQQSYTWIRWFLFREFIKSTSDKLDRSNVLSAVFGSLLTLFVFWIFNIIESWFWDVISTHPQASNIYVVTHTIPPAANHYWGFSYVLRFKKLIANWVNISTHNTRREIHLHSHAHI